MIGLMKCFFLLVIVMIIACNGDIDQTIKRDFSESMTVVIKNETNLVRIDEAIQLDVKNLKAKRTAFNPEAFVVFCDDKELASQACDLNGDTKKDLITFICDCNPNDEKRIELRYAASGQKTRDYTKRTQAELSHKFGGKFIINEDNRPEYKNGEFKNVQFLQVPPQHTDHTFFIRYEGPGWESDKVGYRFYLDWRNAIDVFGKKTSAMVLQDVGQDGFDSYHEMSDWGMDVLKVGDALGIGSIGMWFENKANRVSQTDSVTCEIVINGPIGSLIRTKYFGWKVGSGVYELTSNLSICAGSRLTRHEVSVTGNPDNLCTGIVKLPETNTIKPESEMPNWRYFATYGKQSLAEDQLGMAILFRKNNLIDFTEDEFNHIILLKPDNGQLTYYFLAAWELEPDGIKNESEFVKYLDQLIEKLDSPISVTF